MVRGNAGRRVRSCPDCKKRRRLIHSDDDYSVMRCSVCWEVHYALIELQHRPSNAAIRRFRLNAAIAGTSSSGVYIIREEHGLVKIGCSHDVKRRLFDIAQGMPYDIKVLRVIPFMDYRALERYFHEAFAYKRVKGEWFKLSAKDIRMLKAIQEPYDIEVYYRRLEQEKNNSAEVY